ncbi:MAG TPA: hypothetical protein VJO35_15950 [Terriglobales bacterium]|nr:hypothetical protein [Terriglobales bacterium]
MIPWAPFGLTAVTAALLIVPISPALLELRRRNDAAPLPTSRHDGKITNFADSFSSHLEPLRSQLEQCRASREIRRIQNKSGDVLLVGLPDFDFDAAVLREISAVMCVFPAYVPAGRVIETDICADGGLRIGEAATVRAALSAEDVVLGPNSSVFRWLYAKGNIFMQAGSAAYGRLSSGTAIVLDRGCGFQRMHATRIIVAIEATADSCAYLAAIPQTPQQQNASQTHSDEGDSLSSSRPRMRVDGDFVLPAGETMHANIIATGEVRIGRGASLFGNAKSYKDTIVEESGSLFGAIVCGGNICLGLGSFARGPLMAEGHITMNRGSCVGKSDALTTVSASHITITDGCNLHGTVWARVLGRVEG